MDPACPIGRQSARRHDTVDMRMMLEALPPGVKDHESANRGTQALRVRGHLSERGRRRTEEQVVHHALIGERQTGERLRYREDDVDVADWEELLLASRHPRVPRRGQTLRAMPITAAVVRESRLRTLLTAIAVPAERRRAALRDRPEDASMRPCDPAPVHLQDAIAMSADDVGHLEGWPGHRGCNLRERFTLSSVDTVRVSNGFGTAVKCRCDRWR